MWGLGRLYGSAYCMDALVVGGWCWSVGRSCFCGKCFVWHLCEGCVCLSRFVVVVCAYKIYVGKVCSVEGLWRGVGKGSILLLLQSLERVKRFEGFENYVRIVEKRLQPTYNFHDSGVILISG